MTFSPTTTATVSHTCDEVLDSIEGFCGRDVSWSDRGHRRAEVVQQRLPIT